LQRLTDAYGF